MPRRFRSLIHSIFWIIDNTSIKFNNLESTAFSNCRTPDSMLSLSIELEFISNFEWKITSCSRALDSNLSATKLSRKLAIPSFLEMEIFLFWCLLNNPKLFPPHPLPTPFNFATHDSEAKSGNLHFPQFSNFARKKRRQEKSANCEATCEQHKIDKGKKINFLVLPSNRVCFLFPSFIHPPFTAPTHFIKSLFANDSRDAKEKKGIRAKIFLPFWRLLHYMLR